VLAALDLAYGNDHVPPVTPESSMDFSDFIFRDDAVEPLGASGSDDDDFAASEESAESVSMAKVGLAAIGSAVLGVSHFLGHVTKSL
jgi:hypothetical protein